MRVLGPAVYAKSLSIRENNLFPPFNDHIYIFFREAVWLCCTLKQSDVCNPRKLTDNTPRRLCIRRVQHERIS